MTTPLAGNQAPESARADPILERLGQLHPKVIDLSLGRVHGLLAALGYPERRLPPVVHIAGTNGKGSLVALLRAVLAAGGYKVNTYTSPHLVRFNERIDLDGRAIDDAVLTDILRRCEAANDGRPITFFEITTAAAFEAFAASPADIVILETGLGGRLDATNVIDRPALTAITPISIDHQQFLGDSLTEIAGEKAAILKPGVAGVIGPQTNDAAAVIDAAAARCAVPLFAHGRDWTVSSLGDGFSYRSTRWTLDLPRPGLAGPHQVVNAGTAVACLENLADFPVSPDDIATGLARATWPGRLQRIRHGALAACLPDDWELWVDGGHNADAGATLAEAARALWPGDPLYLVVGMLNSKSPCAFLAPMARSVRGLTAIAIPGEANAIPAADLAAAADALGMATATADGIENAIQAIAMRHAPAGPARVLVTGSLYLAGEVLALSDQIAR